MLAQLAETSKSATSGALLDALERDGFAFMPPLLQPEQLRSMQQAFAARLQRQRWNDLDGYEKTERHRHMIQDVLTLDQGFVDLALHPLVKEVIRAYIGEPFSLVEAKGWKSLPAKRDFHGWHGDAWYDQTTVRDHIPREVKVGFYLTDVRSGAFRYLSGSHGKQAPRGLKKDEFGAIPEDRVVEALGNAGTVFVFDTSGIHRQSVPILEPRQAVFFNYHDPRVPLQQEDLDYYRYHPLLLNAAFLGNLTEEDQRILGFGDKTNYLAHYERSTEHRGFQTFTRWAYDLKLLVRDYRVRLWGRLRKLMG